MRMLLLLLASAAVLGGGLASGSHGESRQASPAAGGIDPRSGGFEIVLGEWALSPEAKAIRPGPVTLVIRNRGKFRHGLELRRVHDHRHGGDHEDWESVRLEPGQATKLTLNLAPGVYEIECFVSHHDDLVREDAPFSPRRAVATPSTVDISGFVFKPATLKTTVGKYVTWRNRDAAPHTAAGTGFSSPTLAKGQTYRRRFTKVGRYTYICALHPGMKGTVIVASGSR